MCGGPGAINGGSEIATSLLGVSGCLYTWGHINSFLPFLGWWFCIFLGVLNHGPLSVLGCIYSVCVKHATFTLAIFTALARF